MTKMIASSFSILGEGWLCDQRRRADILNTPPFGHPSNRGIITNSQLNFSGVARNESTGDLSKDLGNAGRPHTDSGDDPQALTAMVPISDAPNCHPGFFFLLELLIYFEMDNFTIVIFCGLRLHGGSAPRPLQNEAWRDFYIRLNYIAYNNYAIANRTNNVSLASGPPRGRKNIHSSVEVYSKIARGLQDPNFKIPSLLALNEARDELSLADAQATADHLAHELVLAVQQVVSQMPASLQFKVNPRTLLSSMSYGVTVVDRKTLHHTQERRQVQNWTFAPGADEDTTEERRVLLRRISDRSRWCRMSMPAQLGSDFKEYLAKEGPYKNPEVEPVLSTAEQSSETETAQDTPARNTRLLRSRQ